MVKDPPGNRVGDMARTVEIGGSWLNDGHGVVSDEGPVVGTRAGDLPGFLDDFCANLS